MSWPPQRQTDQQSSRRGVPSKRQADGSPRAKLSFAPEWPQSGNSERMGADLSETSSSTSLQDDQRRNVVHLLGLPRSYEEHRYPVLGFSELPPPQELRIIHLSSR